MAYNYRKNKNQTIEPELNEELAKRFPGHEIFLSTEKAYGYIKISQKNAYDNIINIPTPAEIIKADSLSSKTVLIDCYGRETTCPLIKIQDKNNLKKQNHIIESLLKVTAPEEKVVEGEKVSAPTKMEFSDSMGQDNTKQTSTDIKKESNITNTQKNKNATALSHTQEIVVSVKQIKITLEGVYNNIFVNGKKLLSNHINTQIKTFGNGVILAIHGTVINDARYPTTPMWLIYDTNLQLCNPRISTAFSNRYIQVKSITGNEKIYV